MMSETTRNYEQSEVIGSVYTNYVIDIDRWNGKYEGFIYDFASRETDVSAWRKTVNSKHYSNDLLPGNFKFPPLNISFVSVNSIKNL